MVARPSIVSLLLLPSFGGTVISTATGFVAGTDEAPQRWLITNWHVATGRNPHTRQPLDAQTGAVPDALGISHHVAGQLGSWHLVSEPLYDPEGTPLWLEHPDHRRRVDVIALPLTNLAGSDTHMYEPRSEGAPIVYGVSRPLSIIGFPFGQPAGGRLGVWTQGYVASEPTLDFNDLPCFLVDARTRGGQSGSPVIAYAAGGMVPMEDGGTAVLGGPLERFVGVYSGRLIDPHDPVPSTDLGLVWKRSAVAEILEQGVPGST